MSATPLKTDNNKPDIITAVKKRVLQVSIWMLVQVSILCLSSGRLDWVMAWVYIGLNVAIVAINFSILLPQNPELIAERAPIKEDTKKWDIVLVKIALPLPHIILLISGLDLRFGWSPPLTLTIQLLALALMVLGYSLVSWAMITNKFFSGVVRIQKERGHTTITTGPYQYVRHPGYTGMIVYSLSTPLLLSSLWAFIPAVLMSCLLIVRTLLEDRTLQAELDGYQEYTTEVPYRLLPYLW
ncbi:MAG: isoprenylcysteine carboxylmethyltransferase family protein [Prochloraceae cyanobacterium]|nr:isoprenylcysteine carboxylmethyltransferase family protein [Prochloraceae cyanobacterium]